jgi:dihydrofolate synthase/folylpolyglutamate synthase
VTTAKTLAEWLDHQQRVHPRAIELGLERVSAVWKAMGAPAPAPVVITVGGTNGKGSTVAFLEAMLGDAGQRVGAYTSPHLLRYNERVRVGGSDADDSVLIDAFERIETARGATALTYFEFGTLAALWIFAQSKLDVALLEVGLGGRLDAVNIIDADVAIVTTVDLDHQDWLGNDVDSIGREKAGILRQGRSAIVGMRGPPAALLTEAERIGANLVRAEQNYFVEARADGWRWRCNNAVLDLPQPALAAPSQIDNAAAAIAALYALRGRIGWSPDSIANGVRNARAPARLQRLYRAGAAELVVDVAHNPQAARILAQWLARNPPRGHTLAVFGALSDKDVGGIVAPLLTHISTWMLGSLARETPRGLTAEDLRARMPVAVSTEAYSSVDATLQAACDVANADDRILAFGSFFVAAATLNWAQHNGYGEAQR